jgi:hypothetical protein
LPHPLTERTNAGLRAGRGVPLVSLLLSGTSACRTRVGHYRAQTVPKQSPLEKELREVGQVLPPKRPRMPNVRGFRVGDLDALGIQIRLELPVRRKRSKVGSAAGNPKKLYPCVRIRIELGELVGAR